MSTLNKGIGNAARNIALAGSLLAPAIGGSEAAAPTKAERRDVAKSYISPQANVRQDVQKLLSDELFKSRLMKGPVPLPRFDTVQEWGARKLLHFESDVTAEERVQCFRSLESALFLALQDPDLKILFSRLRIDVYLRRDLSRDAAMHGLTQHPDAPIGTFTSMQWKPEAAPSAQIYLRMAVVQGNTIWTTARIIDLLHKSNHPIEEDGVRLSLEERMHQHEGAAAGVVRSLGVLREFFLSDWKVPYGYRPQDLNDGQRTILRVLGGFIDEFEADRKEAAKDLDERLRLLRMTKSTAAPVSTPSRTAPSPSPPAPMPRPSPPPPAGSPPGVGSSPSSRP